jgi:hypothetical protein
MGNKISRSFWTVSVQTFLLGIARVPEGVEPFAHEILMISAFETGF